LILLARPQGFEPWAYGFVVRYLIFVFISQLFT